MDPWYDYLPAVAPLVLLVQIGALVLGRRKRLLLVGAGTVVTAAMLVFVLVFPAFLIRQPADSGANIGAGLLFLQLLVSLAVLGVAVLGPR